ncbi:hypothetical protein [Tanticharoenia sakaeratensis]|jgi:hypothetical protein|uniref:Uncharacterized protein n=1 Tax=Tanticharoenia sakaeratensis NBRC 103193 TaxID=1231623 RepID=A0A0D6MHH3_9PROT|nr:hypothetical protein [Tanticharoenia sakaeratensis]GAN53094.1 hypothetical protein Tasa_005_009 [Tanticharoenia sakaeratensis NBRC 103193]
MKALAIAAAAFLACGNAAHGQTARQVMADIRAHGASAEIANFDRHGWLDDLLDPVASGNADWIAVSAALFPGTDAGTTEALLTALSQALARNPQTVLQTYGATSRLPDICTDRLIEPPPDVDLAFRGAVLKALSDIRDPALAPARDRCLASFNR